MKNQRKKYNSLFKLEDFVINVGLLSTHTNNAQSKSINLLCAFTAQRKATLRESAPRMRKDCIGKEDHASGAGQYATPSRTAQ